MPPALSSRDAGFGSNGLLFGCSHQGFQLTPDDKAVSFTTQLGKLEVKIKFNLKDMCITKSWRYKGKVKILFIDDMKKRPCHHSRQSSSGRVGEQTAPPDLSGVTA
jgi:hypothetical protein